MKLKHYFNLIVSLVLLTTIQAHAQQTYGLYIQNYTGTTLEVFYKYCIMNSAKCSGDYSSGEIASNSYYIIPPDQNYDYVMMDKANTDDNWVFVNANTISCILYIPAIIPEFVNFSKSLVSPYLQCATSYGRNPKA